MAKWGAPSDFRASRATRQEIKAMTPMVKKRNTCPYCETVYRTHDSSVDCETWHQVFFRKALRDLTDAAKRAEQKGDIAQAQRLRRQMRDYPQL